jgi:hypothetical protein
MRMPPLPPSITFFEAEGIRGTTRVYLGVSLILGSLCGGRLGNRYIELGFEPFYLCMAGTIHPQFA